MEETQSLQKAEAQSLEPAPAPAPAPASTRYIGATYDCCLIIKIILFVGFFVLLFFLVLWLGSRSQNITVSVESAVLRAFNLTSGNSTLRHDLSVGFSISKRKKQFSRFYYDDFRAEGYFNGEYLFNTTTLPAFSHRLRRTVWPSTAMAGESRVELRPEGAELFRKQEREGKFDLEVRLSWKMTNKVGRMVMKKTTQKRVKCWLPELRPDGSSPKGLFGSSSLWSVRCRFY